MTSTTTMKSFKSIGDLSNLDRNSLLNIILEQSNKVQDLERQVDEQRRLRMQDSNQVEEKAAKIKEWVTNKLKELENQNKQLREQNKKQRELIDSLSQKLASLNSLTSLRRRNTGSSSNINNTCNHGSSPDKTVLSTERSVPQSPINTIDVKQSLKTRRPQLKKQLTDTTSLKINDAAIPRDSTAPPSPYHQPHLCEPKQHNHYCNSSNVKHGVSLVAIGENSANGRSASEHRQESPLYDCVNIELVNNLEPKKGSEVFNEDEPTPPPPPPHQTDKWELELYNLAEQAFSNLMNDSYNNEFSYEDNFDTQYSNKDPTHILCKSTSSAKNDIISVIKPSLTTIDGDQVVDSSSPVDNHPQKADAFGFTPVQRHSKDLSSQSSGNFELYHPIADYGHGEYNTLANTVSQTQEINAQKLENQNIFSSPMRSRSSKDSILRTQSVRRNPIPEKLQDFVASDLVKRGNLIKHGALRNHNRWFVLKNFHLQSFKREADELDKTTPLMSLRLEQSFQVQTTSQSGDGYPFKLLYHDKCMVFIADSAQARDEWIGILTVAINMSDIVIERLTKSSLIHEGMLRMARQGHPKRCHAVLTKHIMFFLKSPVDPTPISYVSVKGAKIREVTDINDYDLDDEDSSRQKSTACQDCCLAIYPRFSLNFDPVYLTFGSQHDTDEWFYHLSAASGIDQSNGTEFERILTQMMLDSSTMMKRNPSINDNVLRSGCKWRNHPIMIYSSRPITQPLTSLPNETLRIEAVELFKSLLLFTQVPLEPIAIDYHVCLLQNCFTRFLKYPELRNEFFAQLIKQSTFIRHSCFDNFKLSSSSSSGSTSLTQRSSCDSTSPTSSECAMVTDLIMLDKLTNEGNSNKRYESAQITSHQNIGSVRGKSETIQHLEGHTPPSKSEFLQVMQILAISVSLNLPRGRLRWWLIDHMKKIANTETSIGKYASFTLEAIKRTLANGCRETVPSRTEIMSILLRNPFDHSTPHSLPVGFADGSYLVIGADGSTTVEEFMVSLSRSMNVRPSSLSDFYLFADDPGNAKDLHILEPQRKILDVVGWWEHTCKQSNSGKQQNNRFIKFVCRKRLVLRIEDGETDHERLLIVNQVNHEIVSQNIPLNDTLIAELGAIMVHLNHGDFKKSCQDPKSMRCVRERILSNYIPQRTVTQNNSTTQNIIDHWQKLSGRSSQDCIRVYLNCIRRLNK